MKEGSKFLRAVAAVLVGVICLSAGGCASSRSFESHLGEVTSPYQFHLARWELDAAGDELGQIVSSHYQDNGADRVKEYFTLTSRINSLIRELEAVKGGSFEGDEALLQDELNHLLERKQALEAQVERIIEIQVRDTLSEEGIYNPLDNWLKLEVGFPPVNFKLGEPPYLLVISPREKIETIKTVMLEPDMTQGEVETLETKVDKLGVSSLVVKLSGIATYPAFVNNTSDLHATLEAVAEEWLHQYLVFKPLGFRYLLHLLGISLSYEVATMNETVASMLGQELGKVVFGRYYDGSEDVTSQKERVAEDFDFNREMREIRKTVDAYLLEGKVTMAEEFMKTKRQYLAANGYYIRKLNQAYFAFHGCYADLPTSIDPIGVELRELRNKSVSIKDFLDKVSSMTSREELKASLW